MVRERLYPEARIGGYTRVDSTVEFYTRIGTLVAPDSTVIDLGAGRGSVHADRPTSIQSKVSFFKGRARQVIGIDPDPAVHENPSLDEARLLEGDRLPLDNECADLIFADWVLEHIDDPQAFAVEVARTLKPGGWFCARTPNRWGYIGLATNLVPNRLHTAVLKRTQPGRKERDVFPTRYRINTPGALRRAFPSNAFECIVYGVNSEPAYFGNSMVLWRLAQLMFRLTPPGFEAQLLIFVKKTPMAEQPKKALNATFGGRGTQ